MFVLVLFPVVSDLVCPIIVWFAIYNAKYFSRVKIRWMETQQGEVCRFCWLSLTSVELMSSIHLGECNIFIQEQQNNMLKVYFAVQHIHILYIATTNSKAK